MRRLKKGSKFSKFNWQEAPDIKTRVLTLMEGLRLDYLLGERLFFYRSQGSKARAYARTWGLPKIWQHALGTEPAYIIEVISGYFDKLSPKEQDKVLLHEISHIPKNFSGALVPHTRHGKGSFKGKLEILIDKYFESYD
ncbi:MAG: metallopeptidase-like protein [uncultured bacterium]|nr:MAG: metallopeptidase-like protein [uncultured bacterium]KKR53782.1 MAG: Metallopeptidase-like protein [Candidatus Woesebacteria bacterium GW2011_GWD2_40_19]